MTDITIAPISHKVFGAIITGVSLRKLSDAEFATLHAAFLTYGFLVFPGQFLTDAENIAFGKRFGELEFGALPLSNVERRADGSWGDIFDAESRRMRSMIGNEGWHTDSTYKPLSSKCAMLSAVVVPEEGGQTEFADMRAAYAALDDATKDRIETLAAYHSIVYSQANDLGDFPTLEDGANFHGEAYLRPLVKRHPETGVKSLFVARHAFAIPGLGRQESRSMIKRLVEFAVSEPTRVYQHQWQAGETLLWDNRCLLHRAMPYHYLKPRVLLGTRVAGELASELAYYPDDPAARAGREVLAAELLLLRHETAGKRFQEASES
jgi:alpha-ketoglutarate-dependent taurine dioxygenase